jgi:hypothetical protein
MNQLEPMENRPVFICRAVLQPAFNIFNARAEAPRHFQSLAAENP